MKRAALFLLLLFIATFGASASAKSKPSKEELAEISARGRMLYEADFAAWHASDAVQGLKIDHSLLGRYIAQKTDKGWVVAFGKLSEAKDKFLVAAEARQSADPTKYTPTVNVPPREDSGFLLFAARAIEVVLKDFRGEKRSYNVSVIPAPKNELYVYVYPAIVKDGIYPLGGDVRYRVSSEGQTILEKRQLHRSIIEYGNDAQVPKDAQTAAGYHTHVLSELPEDTDVLLVLLRRPSVPEYVGISPKLIYVIQADGTISIAK